MAVIATALIGTVLLVVASQRGSSSGLWVCRRCETADRPKKHTKGSFAVEVLLWLFFIVPGLIYSLWRLTTKSDVCRSCGSTEVVPFDSPAGRRVTGR